MTTSSSEQILYPAKVLMDFCCRRRVLTVPNKVAVYCCCGLMLLLLLLLLVVLLPSVRIHNFLFHFPFDEIYRRLLFFHSRAYVPYFMIIRYVLCTRYVYTYDTYVLFQIRTYVPGISRKKSIRTYVMFRPWTHTSDLGPNEACTGLTFVLSQ